MSARTTILLIKNLSTGYNGTTVLKDVNLTINEAEICSVIGEEGTGKSTLVKAMTNQIKSNGRIIFREKDLNNVPTNEMINHKIDFIAQGGNIFNSFTVAEHISLSMSERTNIEKHVVWKEIEKTFPKVLQLKDQIAGRLSGGERIIVSMACLLASDTNLLILDEPTAGLAPETCREIGAFLLRMKNELNKTILLCEHNYEFTFKIADSVSILKNGTLSEKYIPDIFRQANFVDDKLFTPEKDKEY